MPNLRRRIERARAYVEWKIGALKRLGGKYIAKQEKRLEGKVRRRFLGQKRWIVEAMAKLSFFQDQGKGVSRLERKDYEGEIDELVDGIPHVGELAEDISETAGQTYRKGARDIHAKLKMSEMDVSFELVNEEAIRYMDNLRNLQLSDSKGSISRETKRRIISILREAAETGQSYNDTASKIQAQADAGVFSQSRAQMVAVHEVGNAYGSGNHEMVRTYTERTGAEVEKQWATVNDKHVTEECMANQEAGWLGYQEAFPSGDEFAPRGDHPRCRCSTVYRRVNMSGEEV